MTPMKGVMNTLLFHQVVLYTSDSTVIERAGFVSRVINELGVQVHIFIFILPASVSK